MRPLHQGLSFSLIGDQGAFSGISELGLMVCPATIFRRVIAVVVDAIQGHAVRALAHVRQKIGIVTPPVTDFDPSSAIERIYISVFVVTPLDHGAPRFVGFGNLAATGMAMSASCV